MYADPAAISSLSRRLRDHADVLRDESHELLRRVESVPWEGIAADAMRRLVRDHLRRLLECAAAHERAADALEHHARAVDRVQQLVTASGHALHDLLGSAAGAVHDGAVLVGHEFATFAGVGR